MIVRIIREGNALEIIHPIYNPFSIFFPCLPSSLPSYLSFAPFFRTGNCKLEQLGDVLNGAPYLNGRACNLVSRVSIHYIRNRLALTGWTAVSPNTSVNHWVPSEKQVALTCYHLSALCTPQLLPFLLPNFHSIRNGHYDGRFRSKGWGEGGTPL